MKNLVITENEKKEIKQLYGVLEEQNVNLKTTTDGNIQIGDTVYVPYTKKFGMDIKVSVGNLTPLSNGYKLKITSPVNQDTTISKNRITNILAQYSKSKPSEIISEPDTSDGKVIILRKK